MPEPAQRKMHPIYKKLEKEAKAMGDNNFCTVLAAAALTGLPYKECYEAFEKAGRVKGKGSNLIEQRKAFKSLGYKMTKFNLNKIKKKYKGHHKELKGLTSYHPIRFHYAWRDVPDLWLNMKAHVAAFKDGKVVDYTKTKKRRLLGAYRIVKIVKDSPFTIEVPETTVGEAQNVKFEELKIGWSYPIC